MRALFWRPGQGKKPDAVSAPRVLVVASEGTESQGWLKNVGFSSTKNGGEFAMTMENSPSFIQ